MGLHANSILAELQASIFSNFWLGWKNDISLVCDILGCPAVKPGLQLPNMILVDVSMIFLHHLILLMTYICAFRPRMSLNMTSLICHTLTLLRFLGFLKRYAAFFSIK